jgi:hypothetical protein
MESALSSCVISLMEKSYCNVCCVLMSIAGLSKEDAERQYILVAKRLQETYG